MPFVSRQLKLDLHALLLVTFVATTKRTDLFWVEQWQNKCLGVN